MCRFPGRKGNSSLRRAEAAVEVSAGRSWLWPCWCGVVPDRRPPVPELESPVPGAPESHGQARASGSTWERTDPPTGGLPTLAGHSCPPSAPVGLEGGHEWLCPPILMHTPPGPVSREPAAGSSWKPPLAPATHGGPAGYLGNVYIALGFWCTVSTIKFLF